MPEPRPGWGNRIFETIKRWADYTFDWMIENIPILRPLKVAQGLGFLIPSDERVPIPILNILLDIPGIPNSSKEIIRELQRFAGRTDVPINELIAAMSIKELLAGYLSPVAVHSAYSMSAQLATGRPDPTTAWIMYFRGVLVETELIMLLKDTGWSESMIAKFKGFAENLISSGEAIQLYWRGDYSHDDLLVALRKQGYSFESIADIIKLTDRIPGPPDLISMAVREAFHPELIAKYHYMDNFPPEFAEYMAKQGFSIEWAQRWWVAHWRLPSITAGFDMLHRGQISVNDLRDLLRTADIAPVWHDPLIAIAYKPYTRVDTRRMHALGVLSDTDLVRNYMDQGYDLEHAVNMAEFTILFNTDKEREATKTDILKGYRKGILSEPDATTALIGIGYPLHLVDYYLSLEDLHAQEEIADEEIKTVQALYVNREIDRSESHARLGALNLTGTQIEKLFERWDIARTRKIIRPSISNLESFYKDGIINSSRFMSELDSRGYLPEYILWYRDSLLIEVEHEAQVEQDRAGKEAERIEKQEIKTAYQEAKAQIDYQIAQLRTQDVHLRILREQAIDTVERRRLEMTIEESILRITEIQRDIAGKRTRLQEIKNRIRGLEVAPDLLSLYDRRDALSLQVSGTSATIANIRSTIIEAQSLIRQAMVSGEIEVLRTQVDTLTVQLAETRTTLAGLRVEIASLNVQITETIAEIATAKAMIREIGVATEVLELYDIKDTLTIQISELQGNIADLRVELVQVHAGIARHRVSPEIMAQRELIDEVLIDISVENELIAEERIKIATIKASLAVEMSSEQVAVIDEQRREIQLEIRRLQEERARLRV